MNQETYLKLMQIHSLLSSQPVSGRVADRESLIEMADNILVGMINCTRQYDPNYTPEWEKAAQSR